MGRGMETLVRGTKGSSCWGVGESRAVSRGDPGVIDGCVDANVDCGAGAVEGRGDGLGSGGSSEVVRSGKEG